MGELVFIMLCQVVSIITGGWLSSQNTLHPLVKTFWLILTMFTMVLFVKNLEAYRDVAVSHKASATK